MSNNYALSRTTWYGMSAWSLESSDLRVVTVPDMGAKIVSIFDKRAKHEWLLPPGNHSFKPVAYGSAFVDQDMSGWDEMFPTINACTYPAPGPYAGVKLPDHGEVWALPWNVNQAGQDVLQMSVSGRVLPYRLSRSMTLTDSRTLRLDYEVVNTGDAPFAGFWAAHPQFSVTSQTEIRLPAEVQQVMNVTDLKEWAPPGQCYPWPAATDQQGKPRKLDRIAPPAEHRCRKFYTLPDQPVSWGDLHEMPTGPWLRLEWDAQQVPYLGLWVDEGMVNPVPTAALEPATGFYDSLELAMANRRVPLLVPHEKLKWHLNVQIG